MLLKSGKVGSLTWRRCRTMPKSIQAHVVGFSTKQTLMLTLAWITPYMFHSGTCYLAEQQVCDAHQSYAGVIVSLHVMYLGVSDKEVNLPFRAPKTNSVGSMNMRVVQSASSIHHSGNKLTAANMLPSRMVVQV